VCGSDVRVPGTPGGIATAVRRPSLVSLPGGAVAMTPMARPTTPGAPAGRAESSPSWAQPARTSSRATPGDADDQADEADEAEQADEAPQVVEAAEAAPGSRSKRGRARRPEPDRSRPTASNGPAAASSLGTRMSSASPGSAGSRQSTQSRSRGQGKGASGRQGSDADTRPPRPEEVILASAIFMTGSRGLAAGSRYGIGWSGDQLRILGPVDVDPKAIAISRSLRGLDATGTADRLVISATSQSRDRLVLVFMSVSGSSAEAVAEAISQASADLDSTK
jgi:hypothetical protein